LLLSFSAKNICVRRGFDACTPRLSFIAAVAIPLAAQPYREVRPSDGKMKLSHTLSRIPVSL
jgi:hypothetical protein